MADANEDVERVALALVNSDQRKLDLPELTSVDEFRSDVDRDKSMAAPQSLPWADGGILRARRGMVSRC